MSAFLSWLMNTLFTSAFTMIAKITMGSSWVEMISLILEVVNLISRKLSPFCLTGDLWWDMLNTSFKCFFLADFMIPLPANPLEMTWMILAATLPGRLSCSWWSDLHSLFSSLLVFSFVGEVRLLRGLLYAATYFIRRPSRMSCLAAFRRS